MSDPVIRCRDLVRIYAADGVEVQALQGLDLTVQPAELTAVVGASGSGKSTLLSILSGIDRPTAGTVRVAGHDLTALRERERVAYRRDVVGFVFQQTADNLLPYLTVGENIALPMLFARRRRPAGRVAELVALLGLEQVVDLRPPALSGGQQQRAAIAVALANGPALLLADEPTGQLDTATSEEVLDAIRTVNEETGTTVLIVTHDPAVSEHVRRTIEIRDGRTATETIRSGDGDDALVERYSVIDPAGRLQLPADYTERLGLRDRVRLRLEPDHVAIRPGTTEDE